MSYFTRIRAFHRKNLYFCTVFVNENDVKVTNKVNLKK
jgi:hypothetical protein